MLHLFIWQVGAAAEYPHNITIPSSLIVKQFDDKLKVAIDKGDMVIINLDWTESVPHPEIWLSMSCGKTTMTNAGQSMIPNQTLERILKGLLKFLYLP